MFVKVVHSIIAFNRVEHYSITSNPYSIQYIQGEWAKPVLPGSRLFVYKDLRTALKFHDWPDPDHFPYTGITFWYVNVIDPSIIEIFKDLPAPLAIEYWRVYNNRKKDFFAWEDFVRRMPWQYKFKEKSYGRTYACKAVMLYRPMVAEDYLFKMTPWQITEADIAGA
jgi:hypothetical protein